MNQLVHVVIALALCVVLPIRAHAQEAWPTPEGAPIRPIDEPSPDPSKPAPPLPPPLRVVGAKDVANAPHPGTIGGVVVADQTNSATALLIGPRALLLLPRWGFEVAMAPLRGLVWAYERYQLGTRTKNIFFNDSGTFGVFPVFFVETGFGANAGLRVVDKNLFGANESLALRLSYGGRFRQLYTAHVDSGNRFGRLTIDVGANYAIQPLDQFFGIGNSDERSDYVPMVDPLLDPTAANVAVNTRYREEGTRFFANADVRLRGGMHLSMSSGVMLRNFENLSSDDADLGTNLRIQEVFDTTSLVGFSDGLSTGYGELRLRYDSRRNRSRYVSQAVPSLGWLLAGHVSYANGLAKDDPTDYWRFAVDLQRNINVYDHSRILILRLYGETVVGDSDKVPFTDLARLGGRTLLRGFGINRFRDKAATLASAEYQWELTTNVSAFLFSDFGRVWHSLHDVELSGTRVGFGGGVQFHSRKTFLARLDVSSSRDGGLFINFAFDPVYDTRARAERD